jgi:Polyketide cyclase / dehydrase and lipid transport
MAYSYDPGYTANAEDRMTMTGRVVWVERSIPAAPSDVWGVLADLPNHASWRKDVKASRMLGEATSGVGARRHLDLAPVGGLDETVLGWEEGSKMVVAVEKASVVPIKSGEATLVVGREGDDQSRVTMEFRYVPKGGPFGRVIGGAVDGQLTRVFRGVLADLEQAVRKS